MNVKAAGIHVISSATTAVAAARLAGSAGRAAIVTGTAIGTGTGIATRNAASAMIASAQITPATTMQSIGIVRQKPLHRGRSRPRTRAPISARISSRPRKAMRSAAAAGAADAAVAEDGRNPTGRAIRSRSPRAMAIHSRETMHPPCLRLRRVRSR